MKCVIVGASPDVYWDGRWTPDMVICADGGARNALALGLKADMIIGDNDSGGFDLPARDGIPCQSQPLPEEKDMTDMEACVDHALREGYGEIVLVGASGGRADHFLGNIGLLERADGKAFMLYKDYEIYLPVSKITVNPPHRFRYYSLIPLDGMITGVTLTGAKYPLNNATLHRSATRGVSNEPVTGTSFSVSVKTGKALLVLSEKVP